jgi:hypothetical protein
MSRTRRATILAAVLAVHAGLFAAAQERRLELSILGGVNSHFAYGSASDYALGTNDFPITPVHTSPAFGLGLAYRAGRWGFELDVRATLAAKVLMSDPSDGDAVEIDTYPHLAAGLNVFFQPWTGRIRPYLLAGGGVDAVFARDRSYTSRFGYAIAVSAPRGKDRFDPEVHTGGGLFIDFSRSLGLRIEARYVWVFDDPKPVRSVQAFAGLVLGF